MRDPDEHLDVTLRARAGTLATRTKDATVQVIAVGALPMVLQQLPGLVAARYLPAGLHGSELSTSALNSFRAAITSAVWSYKLPMASPPALLNLLDAPWASDPVFVAT